MRSSSFVASALLVSVLAAPGLASAKGCLKGAAVGGVGGHVAGHHGLIGAAAGCAVGHHMATKKANAEKANADQNAVARDLTVNKLSPDDAAKHWLDAHQDTWQAWLPHA